MSAKSEAVSRIGRVLSQMTKLEDLHSEAPEFLKWRLSARRAINYSFGDNSRHWEEFESIRFDPTYFSYTDERQNRIIAANAFHKGLIEAKAHFEAMLEEVDEDWDNHGPLQGIRSAPVLTEQQVSNRVFVVHGRDGGTRDTVARFLESLELEHVILQEQPSEGRTIIEKFEDYSNVGYAVVLCTPDDVGALASEQDKLRPRPRQNVVLELGFFLGRLGRNRVSALLDGDMEMPSDYGGVLYVPLDDSEGWKLTLAREMRAAGISIDMNRIP